MKKKAVSLIFIFFTVLTFTFIGFFDYLVGDKRDADTVQQGYAYAIDRSGTAYSIQSLLGSDGKATKHYLVAMDSTGKKNYEKDITEIIGEGGLVDNIFCDYNKNIILTVYQLKEDTLSIENAAIHMFREDGIYLEKLFEVPTEGFYNRNVPIIGDMSEKESYLSWGLLEGSQVKVYGLDENTLGAPVIHHTYDLEKEINLEDLNGFGVLPSKEVLLSVKGGKIIKLSPDGITTVGKVATGAIIKDFFIGNNQVWCRDLRTGDIWVTPQNVFNFKLEQSGDKRITGAEDIYFKDLQSVVISNVGNVMGLHKEESGVVRGFNGGFTYLSEMTELHKDGKDTFSWWLLVIGGVVGCLLVSLFIWEFYSVYLHMRLPLFLRQFLLATVVVVLFLFLLMKLVIGPGTDTIWKTTYEKEKEQELRVFYQSLTAAVTAQDTLTPEEAIHTFFDGYREAEDAVFEADKTLDTPRIYVIEKSGGEYLLVDATEGYEPGYPVKYLPHNGDLIGLLKQVETEGVISSSLQSDVGGQLGVFLQGTWGIGDNPIILYSNASLGTAKASVATINNAIYRFIVVLMTALVIGFMGVEAITSKHLRRLKKEVEYISTGEYDHQLVLQSGDEVEEVAESVNILVKSIKVATKRLRLLNDSYYRFVPEKFMKMLGKKDIEEIQKNTQATMETALLLSLQFVFDTQAKQLVSEELFFNINSLLEQVVPIINTRGGTVYEFRHDGLDALFEGDAEAIVQAALAIREFMKTYNQEAKTKGLETVDLRIALAKGTMQIGLIGDESRLQAAVISKELATCKELLALCFESNMYIAATEQLFMEIAAKAYRYRHIGKCYIANELTAVVELFDSDQYELIKVKEAYKEQFLLGVTLFEQQRYKSARDVFMDILKYSSEDGVACNYLYLAEYNSTAENKIKYYAIFEYLK